MKRATLEGVLTAIVALGTLLAYDIAATQVTPRFDVADVRVSPPNPNVAATPNMQGGVVRDGVYGIQTATMVDLIRTAYGVEADAVVGGPSWLEWDRFDILARVPPSTTADTARLMLQPLLAERFKLVLHRDSRPLPGFALRVGKSGAPKLKPAVGLGKSGCQLTPNLQLLVHTCRNMTMPAFAEGLRSMPGARQYFDTGPVVDQTGLRGEWDFEFRYSQTPLPPGGASGAAGEYITILEAIDKQLGLRLEAAKIPTPVLVVDSVNRTPTDNPPGGSAILPPPPPAAFEVASLRLSDPNAPDVRSAGPLPGGRFELRNFPLRQLITLAWGLTGAELTGAPGWLNSVRVDLTAQLPSTEATREIAGIVDINTFLPALRALLTERFKVTIRTEQRPGSGYALVTAKPRLRKVDSTTRTKCTERVGSNPLLSRQVICQNITLKQFAELLPRLSRGSIRGAVLDATAIAGSYDFTVSFSAAGAPPSPAALAAAAGQPQAPDPSGSLSLADALERQLGLKLEKRSVPVPVMVIEHIEQRPTDN